MPPSSTSISLTGSTHIKHAPCIYSTADISFVFCCRRGFACLGVVSFWQLTSQLGCSVLIWEVLIIIESDIYQETRLQKGTKVCVWFGFKAGISFLLFKTQFAWGYAHEFNLLWIGGTQGESRNQAAEEKEVVCRHSAHILSELGGCNSLYSSWFLSYL